MELTSLLSSDLTANPSPFSIRIPAWTHPTRLDQEGSSNRVTSRRAARSTTWTVFG